MAQAKKQAPSQTKNDAVKLLTDDHNMVELGERILRRKEEFQANPRLLSTRR